MMPWKVRDELGKPCRSSSAGLDASPAVMKESSVPPDRRSRCCVGDVMPALLTLVRDGRGVDQRASPVFA